VLVCAARRGSEYSTEQIVDRLMGLRASAVASLALNPRSASPSEVADALTRRRQAELEDSGVLLHTPLRGEIRMTTITMIITRIMMIVRTM
jgi:hypothetical protein